MSELKPYPQYKDSGVEWLGEVPEHWGVMKSRYLFGFRKGLTITKANLVDEGIPCVNYGEVHSKYGFEFDPKRHSVKCVPESYVEQFPNCLISQGDLIFADTSEDLEGSGNFTCYVGNETAFAGYHTIILSLLSDHNYRYISYVLDSQEFRTQIQTQVKGVKVYSISQGILKDTTCWLPSKDEQTQIAAFLDHETGKIDALIEEQKRLIELLQEKRQAVISHAVTKGLDTNVPMKDSGVEWLGEVPEHWEIKPLKYLVELNPPKSNYRGNLEAECSFVPMDKLKLNNIQLDEDRLISEVYSGYTYFEDGDVLSAKVTPCFENRNTAIAEGLTNGVGFGSSEINVFRPYGLNVGFLFYRLLEDNLVGNWTANMLGAGGLKRVPTEVSESFKIAVPTSKEQEEIALYLDNETRKADSLIQESNGIIELLKERRSALISAAVTGKIDVRNWQAPTEQVAS